MTGDPLARATTWVVGLVAVIAAVVSFIHIEHLAVTHGQTLLAALLLPVSIDGTVAVSSLCMVRTAREGSATPWLARVGLALSVGATLAANIGYGLGFGIVGALLSGWPAIAFIVSAELGIGMLRRGRQAADAPMTQVALDSEEAARNALAASIAVGNPLSQRKLISNYGLTRSQAVRLTAESNGHVPAGQ